MKLNKFLSAIFFAAVLFFQFSCQKDYSFERGTMSTGSIIMNTTTNSCIATASGSYNVGNALNSNNFILDSIDVTSAGSYSITTDTVNGIWFKAVGKITNTGHFAVKLMGYGTPATKGTFNYTLTYDSTSCVVSVFVDTATTSTGSGSSYYLKATIGGTAYDFSDTISDTLMKNTVSGITTAVLDLKGTNNSTTANFTLSITKLGSSITTGTYSNTSTSAFSNCIYLDASSNGYISSTSYPFSTTISSITSTKVTGTFSGTLVAAGGTNTLTLTNGSFSVPLQ